MQLEWWSATNCLQEAGAVKMRAAEVGALETRARENNTDEMCISEISAL